MKTMPSIEDVKHLQIPLREISLATNGFAKENFIGEGGFGPVYKGISKKHGSIAVKRLVYRQMRGQGDHQFKTEIALLSKYKHENIVSLRGFCDEEGEKILVYRYEINGSLDKHLNNENLTWIQRLWICLDAARGLQYLHDNVGSQLGIFHRDVKSPNILLDEGWKAKISDFGLSRARPANMQASFLISYPCGTEGYIDPDYNNNCYLTQKSDVYSFGVVLWEVLCGRLAYVPSYNDDRRSLAVWVEKHYARGMLDKIIPSYLHKQMNTDSLRMFSKIAYQCLKNREERPTMKEVVYQLQEAIDHQLCFIKKPEEEAKPSIGEKEKGEDSRDPAPCPSQQQQEIVLSIYMHCQSCARDVKRCLKGFEGVEDVVTDCETHTVVVKGEKVDPLKVLERIKMKSHRNVELLSPSLTEGLNELELSKSEEKKYEVKNLEEGEKEVEEAKPAFGDEEMVKGSKDQLPPPSPQEIVLNVFMDCEGCAKKVRRCLKGFEGVEDVVTDCETQKVVVKGRKVDPLKVLERVQKICHQKVELLPEVQKPLRDEPKKPKQEKPRKQGWKSWF
ncbi:putative protein kinase RLK-Pelle-CrRLK1L-1 family [Helianthus annuus]|uniref:Uncharacterized protein n=2 Tax=Helianthus annuus TaxID=4232 RepID=A0A9K3HF32_HELAN|nr:receptor-like protein kinase HERK 1 [Helianthus annuus]KAF5777161.1 putative protein kinase RLK-Pelle-CrRLK1L-1 family [Helianthus annuus]KAJ0488754.1 putative protein kinase RLK-Pelle-CrRLK1L-1 family [Helianthus annuus]KAJ0504591.1 putative protein kinase RLK-Pelle-CrRLK1L-1 family [Helianthus annuus]